MVLIFQSNRKHSDTFPSMKPIEIKKSLNPLQHVCNGISIWFVCIFFWQIKIDLLLIFTRKLFSKWSAKHSTLPHLVIDVDEWISLALALVPSKNLTEMKKNAFDPSNVTHLSSQKYTIKIANEIVIRANFNIFLDKTSNRTRTAYGAKTEPKPFV